MYIDIYTRINSCVYTCVCLYIVCTTWNTCKFRSRCILYLCLPGLLHLQDCKPGKRQRQPQGLEHFCHLLLGLLDGVLPSKGAATFGIFRLGLAHMGIWGVARNRGLWGRCCGIGNTTVERRGVLLRTHLIYSYKAATAYPSTHQCWSNEFGTHCK